MAVDTPATIGIIGAGPIGLEAALYARYLGYDVQVYERAQVADALVHAGGESAGVPWVRQASPLGIAALAAQTPDWRPPAPEEVLGWSELAARYYRPLADSDLLADCLRVGSEVVTITRPDDVDPAPSDDDIPGFVLHIRDAAATRTELVDVVLDAAGAASRVAGSLAPGLSVVPARGLPGEPAVGRVLTGEADYYLLGAKSAAAGETVTIGDGLAQIRALFALLADRAALDLYAAQARP